MKKNLLQQLTEANNLDELNLGLDMTDIQYIRSVTAYAVNQGVGLMEAEIIRKDLIGMAGEAKKEGKLLNQRLGDVKEFAKDLAAEGKRGNRKDRVYSSLETVGLIYLLGGLVVFVMYFFIGEMEALESGFFNLMYLIWLLLFPWLIALWNLCMYGRFALMRKFETVFSLISVILLMLPSILFRYIWRDAMPFSKMILSHWVFLIIAGLGGVLYWYGKIKFNAMIEECARQHHLKIGE